MEAKPIDAREFRDEQRDQWNGVAAGWQKWSEQIDEAAGGVSQRLVEMADIKPGDRVLDVAGGYGEPSLTAARTVGPEGSVVATDISAKMLGFGRHGEGAAAQIRGLLKPGGRFAISSWGSPERVPFLAIPMRTAMERLDVPPPPPGTPGPLSRPTEEALGGLLKSAGFSDVEVEETEVSFEWDSPEEFTTFTQDIAAPIKAMIAAHPEDVQTETWAAITDAIREQTGGDGPISLSSLALLAAGRA